MRRAGRPYLAAFAHHVRFAHPAATTPAISIPPELIGRWESDLREFYGEDVCLECGTETTLTLWEDGWYTLARGATTGHR
jgi:hypothetical protein